MFSLLTLLDDIAATLDDVAVMTKVAMKKTSALMSDDLAVNAAVVDGVRPERELPMVKAIFLGSLLNKVYCIVGVLILMTVWPFALKVILLLGGVYLSYEGAHKVQEKLTKGSSKAIKTPLTEVQKVKGAIKTDLILSIEIIVIAKNSLSGSLSTQIISLCVIGLVVSILIYGLVALLVKIDDFGLYLIKNNSPRLGKAFVVAMPKLMKALGMAGTIAMFLVGGGILAHTFHIPYIVAEILQNLIIGLILGFVALIVATGVQSIRSSGKKT
jgi:hypothetical protein